MSDTVTIRPDDCCWAASGWDDAGEGSVRDARNVSRDKARADFARYACEPLVEARVWKRYMRTLPRADLYVWWVENRSEGEWEAHDARGLAPDEVPGDWDESVLYFEDDCPRWEFVHRLHPEAIPVWVCGWRGDDPPRNPVSAGSDGEDRPDE